MGRALRTWGIVGVVAGAAVGCGRPEASHGRLNDGARAAAVEPEAEFAAAGGSAAHGTSSSGGTEAHGPAGHDHDHYSGSVAGAAGSDAHGGVAGAIRAAEAVASVHDSDRDADHAAAETRVATRLELNTDADAGELVLRLGPIELHGGHTMTRTPLLSASLPFATILTGFEVELRDAAGRPLPRALLHHVNVLMPERSEMFRPIPQRLVAAGSETERIELPWPFGVPMEAGQELLVYGMLHDPDGLAASPVTVEMRLPYTARGRQPVQPFFIDVRPPPGPASWDVPPGRSPGSWEGRPAVDGRILAVGGHLHRYGVELILEDVTAGRELLRLRPELDEDGSVAGVERRTFIGRLGLPLRRDHTYRITAVYDNPTGETIRNGGMGAIGGMVWKRGEWPAGAQQDPAFMEDLEQLRTSPGVHVH
jgi:hypothetical protein